MKKRFLSILMLMAMCLALVVSASAADITDPVGRIHCDVMTEVGSYLNGGSPTNGGDTFRAKATSIVSGRTAGETMNIYAKASVTSPDGYHVYDSQQSTEHYKTRTSAITNKDKVRRGWYQEELTVMALGLSRARYTNNKVSEHTGGYQTGTIGGDYLNSDNPNVQDNSNNGMTIGLGKSQNLITVVNQVFGKDLSNYDYASFTELWMTDDDTIPHELLPLRKILTDIFAETKEGESLPLGFLYQGNEAYTVIRQVDDTLKLIKYEIFSTVEPDERQLGSEVLLDYKTVNVEVESVTQNILHALYK